LKTAHFPDASFRIKYKIKNKYFIKIFEKIKLDLLLLNSGFLSFFFSVTVTALTLVALVRVALVGFVLLWSSNDKFV